MHSFFANIATSLHLAGEADSDAGPDNGDANLIRGTSRSTSEPAGSGSDERQDF